MLTKVFKLSLFMVMFLGINLTCYALKYPKATRGCTLVSGSLIQMPNRPLFKFNKAHQYNVQHYPQSHTYFYIRSADNQVYKVVLDNLYYAKISLAQLSANRDVGVIADLSASYPLASNVEVCGKLNKHAGQFTISATHSSNCLLKPYDGFLRINGQEISNNQNYCSACACQT